MKNRTFQLVIIVVNIPQFNGSNLIFISAKKEILYSTRKQTSSLIDENSLQITNVVYENIEESKLGDLAKETIPTSIKATIKNNIARDVYSVILTISPIIKEGSSYKKIISFTYEYSASSSRVNLENNTIPITNSVLSSGKWYRFYVEKSGVYKISKSFLESLGIKTSTLNPKKIKLYGNGGRMVPLSNSSSYPFDLTENAIQVIGEDDLKFDSSDYVLFYGEGVDNWSQENQTNLNLYSEKSYYYINIDGQDGKRILDLPQPSGSATVTINTFDDEKFHEKDLNNIGRLGRVWFGESFSSENEQEFDLKFENIVTTIPATIEIHVGGNSFVSTNFNAKVNTQDIGTVALNPVTLNSGVEASHNTLIANIPATEDFNVILLIIMVEFLHQKVF